jgi:hypothetical protein
MTDLSGWVALAATCIAALLTASNLAARVTGWGFVIFMIGAVAWILVGAATGAVGLVRGYGSTRPPSPSSPPALHMRLSHGPK